MILEKAPEEKKMEKKDEKKKVMPMVKKEEKKEVKPMVKKEEPKEEEVKKEKEYFRRSDRFVKSNLILRFDDAIEKIEEYIKKQKIHLNYILEFKDKINNDKIEVFERDNGMLKIKQLNDKVVKKLREKNNDEIKFYESTLKYFEERIKIYENEKNKINKINLKTKEGSNILDDYYREVNSKSNMMGNLMLTEYDNDELRLELESMKKKLKDKYKEDPFMLYHSVF
jgi:hypothetical protein